MTVWVRRLWKWESEVALPPTQAHPLVLERVVDQGLELELELALQPRVALAWEEALRAAPHSALELRPDQVMA